jgi:2TM domain
MSAGGSGATLVSMKAEEIEELGSPRDRAVAQIKKRRDFQNHLVAFVVVNVAVWAVWAVTGSGYPWPAWITGFWLIGLVFNAWDVYMRRPITEADVQRELHRRQLEH